MTTVAAANVANIAVAGNFDDCQDLVKAMFADAPFRRDLHLSAVNSINWARIAAQIPYYVAAALALGAPEREVAFSVPTGNFGNVLAAWAARRMGLPIARLVVASNRNDILTRFLAGNDMSIAPVEPSLSPSMDIQISSNFERLLFELLDRDPAATAATMAAFRTHRPHGRAACRLAARHHADARLPPGRRGHPGRDPPAGRGVRLPGRPAYRHRHRRRPRPALRAHLPTVAAATAHPAKFPDAMERATGRRPALPKHLADLYERPEHFTTAPNDLDAIEAQVRAFAHRNAA